ncbi:hypothetical protein [Burkholderia sp. AU16741]|uniref:hypothetical protein n=1 Tax=Burkholderia sp. AU16741 TaxID=2015347 RepID=UPI00117C51B9|nr:hypothetical protein [Burkholderia sp. AU16741]
MRFVSMLRVQQGQPRLVPDPLEPRFDLSVFLAAFEANHDGSPEDFQACRFGELIAWRAKRLFDTLDDVEKRCRRFSYDEVATAVAIFTHRQQLTLSTEYADALSNVTEITRDALFTLRTATDHCGNSYTPPEILEATIDSVRHVLRHTRDRKGFGGTGDNPESASIDAVLPVVIRLGYLFESLRNLWHSVLWGSAHAYVGPNPPHNYAIDKTVSALELMACVDLQRRQVVIARDVDEFTDFDLHRQLGKRQILALNRIGSEESRLVATTIDALPEEQRQVALELAILQAAQINLHVKFFLEKSHPSLKELTYKKVLDAWYCIALLTTDDFIYFRRASEENRLNDSLPLTILPAEQLYQALSRVIDVQPQEAKAIVNFLTYKGGRQTIWTRPLLEIGADLIPLWQPLQNGHLMRLVADWGTSDTESGVRFSDKGHKYEDVVHLALDALARFGHPAIGRPAMHYIPLGPRLPVPEKAADGNEVGDVDAAIISGTTLFILECLAIGYPAEPYEFWSAHEALQDKIHQVMRKREHLASNPSVVASWLRRIQATDTPPKIERVVALVVSNSFLLEGERTEEPYFVHADTLFNILLSGSSIFGGGFDAEGREIEFHVDFRSQGVPDADAIIMAVKKPPKRESYGACVKPLDMEIPPFDETDSAGRVRSPVVEMPSNTREIEALIKRCSFAQHTRRVVKPVKA